MPAPRRVRAGRGPAAGSGARRGARHPAVRARRRGGAGRGPGCRGGRLPDQAVRRPRAAGAVGGQHRLGAAAPRGRRSACAPSEARLQAAVDLVGLSPLRVGSCHRRARMGHPAEDAVGPARATPASTSTCSWRRSTPRTGRRSRRPSPPAATHRATACSRSSTASSGSATAWSAGSRRTARPSSRQDRPGEFHRRHARDHRAKAGAGPPARERGAIPAVRRALDERALDRRRSDRAGRVSEPRLSSGCGASRPRRMLGQCWAALGRDRSPRRPGAGSRQDGARPPGRGQHRGIPNCPAGRRRALDPGHVLPDPRRARAVSRAAGIAQDITAHEGSLVYVVGGDTASRREVSTRCCKGAGYEAKLFPSMRALPRSGAGPGVRLRAARRSRAGRGRPGDAAGS